MSHSSKGHTVLVAEDDWLLRQEIVEGLQNIGWIVLEAATGAGALTLKEANTIHLLITDIQLADAVTGWDIAEAFRSLGPQASGDLHVRQSPQPPSPRRGERLPQQARRNVRAHARLSQPRGRVGAADSRLGRLPAVS